MSRTLFVLGPVLMVSAVLAADVKQPESIDSLATHRQVAVISMADQERPLKINAFCLNGNDQIVAACGNGPGEIRLIDQNGTILRWWSVAVKPEAVHVADDETILVGGEGKLFRFSSDGKELQQAESPHAAALRAGTEQLRKEAIQVLTRSSNTLGARIELYERVIAQLEEKGKKGELNDQEQRMLNLLPQTLEQFRKQAALQPEQDEKSGPSEEAIQQQVANLIKSKMRISSVSSGADAVFVATRSQQGYGYDVWKMDREFSAGKIIVTGLRGCCGQMDVQCCRNGLFVAENSRHRVVRYDADGAEVTSWGKQDRSGVDGFSSCCNPMNVCFNKAGEVFTAESGTGRIKRFTADGEFVSYVGDVDLVPGCKNVSIAVTADAGKVFMLDLTRNHIVMMKPGSAAKDADADTAADGRTEGR
ncbi:MAG: hypothetical protein RIK87_19350 [Fuerstiella sp.]